MKSSAISTCEVVAVIVAAGRGERAGQTGGPKQYRQIGGHTVLCHALSAFLDCPLIDTVVVAIHADDAELYAAAIDELSATQKEKLSAPVVGGATRQLSVFAGLKALESAAPRQVLVHDAARPFVDAGLIERTIKGLDVGKASLPSIPVADTIKRADEHGCVAETVSRNGLYAAQTPQGFDFETLIDAHRRAADANTVDFTDDASIAEWAGISVKLVEGSPQNTKITTAADVEQAERKMSMAIPDVRVGHGYDTHQLVDGTSIWLCGVEIPHNRKLSGHSDADVGLHALTDALLAAIADGDIGSHFPPSDEKWRGAKSDQFLAHAVSQVEAAGGTITHMDVTLLCETPKIGPHRDNMRAAIATITGVDRARISVKATTNEKIGFIGREEGMVALATATVVMGTLTISGASA